MRNCATGSRALLRDSAHLYRPRRISCVSRLHERARADVELTSTLALPAGDAASSAGADARVSMGGVDLRGVVDAPRVALHLAVTALGRRLRRGRPARRAPVARRSGGVVALDVTQPEPNPIVVRETTSDFARVVWSGGSSGGFHDPRSCTSRASAARATACARRRCASGIRCLRRPSSASSARAHCRSSRAPNGRAISSSSAPWSRARSSRSTWRRLRRSSFASCTFAAPSTSLSRASERDRWTSPRRDARHRRRGSRLLRGRSPRRPLESPAKSQPRRGRVLARAVLLLHA